MVVIAAAAFCALPGAAVAVNPSIDEYIPTLPDESGDHPVASNKPPASHVTLPSAVRRAAGSDASALEQIVNTDRTPHKKASRKPVAVAPAASSKAATDRVAQVSDANLGSAFSETPVIATLAVLAAILAGGLLARRRRT